MINLYQPMGGAGDLMSPDAGSPNPGGRGFGGGFEGMGQTLGQRAGGMFGGALGSIAGPVGGAIGSVGGSLAAGNSAGRAVGGGRGCRGWEADAEGVDDEPVVGVGHALQQLVVGVRGER